MKIAQLAPPYLPVPPIGYGGTERVVNFLTEGLVKKGHEVTLFAPGDSKTSAKLYSTFPKAIGNSGYLKNDLYLPLLQYSECFRRSSEFDIIHSHAQYLGLFLADLVSTPTVHTIHGTLYKGELSEEKIKIASYYKDQNYISISNNQKLGLPELNWVARVYNGVNETEFPFYEKPQNYLFWIGRISRKKGPIQAIQVAKKLNMKLIIAAEIDPVEQQFYEDEVKPLIDGEQINYLGPIYDANQKSKLYGEALATLYPITWHEPYGLVMAESMMSGTPVVAFNTGSVPEVIKDGVSGYIVSNVDEMVEKVKQIEHIDRKACRQWVIDNFSIEQMVNGYERVYEQVINKKSL